MANILALDIGDRYIGIAALDHAGVIAYRYGTIDRKKQDAMQELQKIIATELVHMLVVGVPYHVEDGSETKQTKKTREFIASMKKNLGEAVRIVEVDETLTSKDAHNTLIIEGADAFQEHAEAARIMLKEYLVSVSPE